MEGSKSKQNIKLCRLMVWMSGVMPSGGFLSSGVEQNSTNYPAGQPRPDFFFFCRIIFTHSPFVYVFPMAPFVLQWQNCVIVIHTVWPEISKSA